MYNGETKKQIDKIAYYQDNLAYFLYFFAFLYCKFRKNGLFIKKSSAFFAWRDALFLLIATVKIIDVTKAAFIGYLGNAIAR